MHLDNVFGDFMGTGTNNKLTLGCNYTEVTVPQPSVFEAHHPLSLDDLLLLGFEFSGEFVY